MPGLPLSDFLLKMPIALYAMALTAAVFTLFRVKLQWVVIAALVYLACFGVSYAVISSVPQECWDEAD